MYLYYVHRCTCTPLGLCGLEEPHSCVHCGSSNSGQTKPKECWRYRYVIESKTQQKYLLIHGVAVDPKWSAKELIVCSDSHVPWKTMMKILKGLRWKSLYLSAGPAMIRLWASRFEWDQSRCLGSAPRMFWVHISERWFQGASRLRKLLVDNKSESQTCPLSRPLQNWPNWNTCRWLSLVVYHICHRFMKPACIKDQSLFFCKAGVKVVIFIELHCPPS